jgi:hypothetical protein
MWYRFQSGTVGAKAHSFTVRHAYSLPRDRTLWAVCLRPQPGSLFPELRNGPSEEIQDEGRLLVGVVRVQLDRVRRTARAPSR